MKARMLLLLCYTFFCSLSIIASDPSRAESGEDRIVKITSNKPIADLSGGDSKSLTIISDVISPIFSLNDDPNGTGNHTRSWQC